MIRLHTMLIRGFQMTLDTNDSMTLFVNDVMTVSVNDCLVNDSMT